jgi:hypothetical protein
VLYIILFLKGKSKFGDSSELNSWIPHPRNKQHICLVSKNVNLEILNWEKMEKNQEKTKQNNCQKIKITNFKDLKEILLNKIFKVIFNNSNIKHINNSDIKFI